MAQTAKKATTKRTTAATKTAPAFTAEEREAMKERAQEVRAARRRGAGGKEDDEQAMLAKIAELSASDRDMAERLHEAITASAPGLSPKLWYGMPGYAKDGKVLCFFQPADKFKSRYATFGFNDGANLDDGNVWPVAFALTKLTAADVKTIAGLVKRAAS
jgi:uncharacterized protein YdhG (YjbR/CyaY superfamily)